MFSFFKFNVGLQLNLFISGLFIYENDSYILMYDVVLIYYGFSLVTLIRSNFILIEMSSLFKIILINISIYW